MQSEIEAQHTWDSVRHTWFGLAAHTVGESPDELVQQLAAFAVFDTALGLGLFVKEPRKLSGGRPKLEFVLEPWPFEKTESVRHTSLPVVTAVCVVAQQRLAACIAPEPQVVALRSPSAEASAPASRLLLPVVCTVLGHAFAALGRVLAANTAQVEASCVSLLTARIPA